MQFQKKGMTRVAAFAGAAALVASAFTATAGATTKVAAHTTYATTKACLVTDTGGINDKSFNASAYAGLTNAKKLSSKITIAYLASSQESDYATNISTFENQHCNIIVTVGFLMSEATWLAAVATPSQHFAQVDNNNAAPYGDTSGHAGPLSNYLGLTYSTEQDAFLGGYEAAAYAASKNPSAPKVATYGGMQFSSVTSYMDGFYDGVQYYNTTAKPAHSVTVLGWNRATQTGTFIGSFNDQATAATDTTAFLTQGATTIFPVAGADGLGTNTAVKQWNASHSIKANVEWVDVDGCISDATDCSIFLNSITKGVTPSVTAAIVAQATAKWGNGGNYVGTLKNGGAAFVQDKGLTLFFSKTAGTALAAKIKTITNDIISGKIKVKVGS
jgi:basic membrane protein A